MSKESIFVKPLFQKRCQHNKFTLDETLNHVECGICGEKLNPMWVLRQFSNREHRLFKHFEYVEKMANKAIAKNRCKCEHCGKMTVIEKQK